MSRLTIALLCVFFAVLVIANVIVLAIWLPSHKSASNATGAAGLTTAAAPATAAAVPPARSGAPSTVRQPPPAPAGFAIERKVASPSGNLQIAYLRDRSTKMRRVTVEDAHHPDGGAVLCESKYSTWALVSPDDQWIVIAERSPAGDGNVRLYHRNSNSSVQFSPTQDNTAPGLQDMVWQAFLSATDADRNTPRRGATINATAWENDSRKIDLSVAYLAGPNNPEVPAPWSCTYDVASKEVQPLGAPGGDETDEQNQASDQPGSDQASANNSSSDNANDSQTDESADNEFPGEKYPATRLDELTVPDVNESSIDEISYAINEMYARHGVDFKDKKVTKEFSGFAWYKPRGGFSSSEAEGEFSDLETQNLKVLQRCRDAKIAASHRKSHPVHGQKVQEETTGEKVLRGLQIWQDMGAPVPPHP